MNRRSFLKFIGTAAALTIFGDKKINEGVAKAAAESVKKSIEPIVDKLTPEVPIVEAPNSINTVSSEVKTDVPNVVPSQIPDENIPEDIKTEVTPVEESIPEYTPTPEAKEVLRLVTEEKPDFKKPFDIKNINEVMNELNLDLGDLFMPTQEKVRNFSAIETSEDILPIFTPQVAQWSELVARKCFEYNIEHPNNKINPNTVLILISLESQGNPDAQSPVGARGLMQLTSWVYGEGFFGNYNKNTILDPENNLEVGIAYLADLIKRAKNLGFNNLESIQYAMMEYNGGPKNASRFFKTKQALDVNGPNSELFQIDSDEKIIKFLRGFYGNSKDYYTYGTNLVKKETLIYKENFTRFSVIAQVARVLKDKGYDDEQIRTMLSGSTLFKSLVAYAFKNRKDILVRDGDISYFELKQVLDEVSSPNFDTSNVVVFDRETPKNPANLVMDLTYNKSI